MSHPLPYSIISWRPFYLTILIFLLALSDKEEGGGVQARRFGNACSTSSDCPETGYCSPEEKVCDCPNFQTQNRLAQYFDEKSRKCLSTVGKRCTFKSDDGLWELNCVPYAICAPKPYLSRKHGECECKSGYKKDNRYLCVPEEEEEDLDKELQTSVFGHRLGIGNGLDLDKMQFATAERSRDDKDDENGSLLVSMKVLESINNTGSKVTSTCYPVGISLLFIGITIIFNRLNFL